MTNKCYKVLFKERGSDEIHTTSASGPITRKDVIEWFGLDGSDVTWYEITEEQRVSEGVVGNLSE